MNYSISEIGPSDRRAAKELDALLAREGIKRDAHLDYTMGLYDCDYDLVATGSCFGNSLRCLAVDSSHQGEGLMGTVVSHLVERQIRRGISHLFLYTKYDKAMIFGDLGFYEIACVPNLASFMENRRRGFADFLVGLAPFRREGTNAALVMNCNPFTLGHRYLVETASRASDTVHLFVVSEDASLFPFADRYELVSEGCADLKNVILHETGSYMISSAVFPSYFLKDDAAAVEVQARLDLSLFAEIARALDVTRRYAGEEPYSQVTGLYNEIMKTELPGVGIEFIEVPRREQDGEPISASRVRQLIKGGRLEEIRPLVPETTYGYFFTERGRETIRRIEAAGEVVHH